MLCGVVDEETVDTCLCSYIQEEGYPAKDEGTLARKDVNLGQCGGLWRVGDSIFSGESLHFTCGFGGSEGTDFGQTHKTEYGTDDEHRHPNEGVGKSDVRGAFW